MLSIFDTDGTLGRSYGDNDIDPGPSVCNCLTGTPRIDANGNCTCDSPGPLGNYGGPRTMTEHAVQYILPWQPLNSAESAKAANASEDFTIFGFSPLTIILVAGGGFFLYSAMSDGGKKAR